MIRDCDFFDWIEDRVPQLVSREPSTLREAVRRSCENKASVVQIDEREGGERAKLNLGHTYGHAIESGSGYGTFLHGEAVTIGIVMAAVHSYKEGWVGWDVVERTEGVLRGMGLPVCLPMDSPMNEGEFARIMSVDKKVSDGVLSLVLLKGELGNSVVTSEYDSKKRDETIRQFVEWKGENWSIDKFR